MTKNNSVLSFTILALLAALLLTVLTLGVYDIERKNREASELLRLADEESEARILVESIRAAQSNAAEDLEAFDNLALSDDKLVPLIDSLEDMGRALNMTADIISVEKTEGKEAGEADIIRTVIEAVGSWGQTLSFLHAVESLPNRVMIEESDLAKEEVGWRLRVTLHLYSFD